MIELNTIYEGDCLNIMTQIPDKYINLILTDLPYGTTTCAWDEIIDFELLWQQYDRILAENGTVVLFGIEPFTSKLILSNIKKFREKLTWIKHRAANIGTAKYKHMKYTEDIVIFSNGKHTYNPQMQPRISPRVREAQRGNSKQWRTNKKDTHDVSFASESSDRSWATFDADFKFPPDYITIPAVVSNSAEKTIHPTQKPFKLFEYLIKTYSNEGEIVLDSCSGSGTTAISSMNTGRNYICIEMDALYIDISKNRINNQKNLFNGK